MKLPLTTRVLVYEDNAALRTSLCQLLATSPGLELAGAFGNCLQTQVNIAGLYPDVVLMDIDMPGMSGIEGLKNIKALTPHVHVLMLTIMENNERVFEALCAGADGYLLKTTSPRKLVEAISDVCNGGAPMTPTIARQVLRRFNSGPAAGSSDPAVALSTREKEVLGLLVEGYSYKMIAADLNISIDTVRFHIKKIYEKLHVRSMTEAVSKALRQGLV
jgi:DNA-binding NarL/FixJ family response regulator